MTSWQQLQKAVSCNIIAIRGRILPWTTSKRLRDMGLYGAIVGKAYYAGTSRPGRRR